MQGQDLLYGSYDGFVNNQQQLGYDNYGSYEAAIPGTYVQGGGYGQTYTNQQYGAGAYGYGGYQQQQQPYPQQPRRLVTDIRGVGIAFGKAPSRSRASLSIRKIYPGSSAHRAHVLQRGDVLLSVNGVDVTMHPVSVLRSIIPGPAFSPVRLGFLRGEFKRFEVDLIRDYKSGFGSGYIPAPAPRPMMAPIVWEQPQVQYLQPVSYIQQPQVTYVQSQPQYVQTTQYVEQSAPSAIEVKGTQV